MRKLSLLLALGILALGAAAAQAMTVKSELGYSLNLPAGWVAFEKGKFSENPEIVDAAVKAAGQTQGMSAIPEKVVAAVKDLIGQGKIDYYFSPEPGFNISVYEAVGNLSPAAKDNPDLCGSLRDELQKEAGSQSKIYECQVKKMGVRDGVYLVAEDYRKDQKYVQQMVQRDSGHVLIFTASSSQQDAESMKKDFMAVMQTVKFE